MSTDVPPTSAPTMHEIAARAGVGKATVSLALRDDPRLRPETRRRIQKVAAKMGYRTNATVANLMAQLRASRTSKYQAKLGLLNVLRDAEALSRGRTYREWIAACHSRSDQMGYGLEMFWLHEPGIKPERLARRMEAEGIRGLVIAGLEERGGLPEEFDALWPRFACVAVGARPWWPPLNFSSNDQFATAVVATQRLWACGYRKLGMVLDGRLDALVERRFSAGYWAAIEGIPDCERIPLHSFREDGEAAFRAWYAKHRPDAILTLHEEVKRWVEALGLSTPEDIGLAHLDRHEELAEWSGMHQNNGMVGEAAVDMLIGQLHRNEMGTPDSPKASFIQSVWVAGGTTEMRAPSEGKRGRGRREKKGEQESGGEPQADSDNHRKSNSGSH